MHVPSAHHSGCALRGSSTVHWTPPPHRQAATPTPPATAPGRSAPRCCPAGAPLRLRRSTAPPPTDAPVKADLSPSPGAPKELPTCECIRTIVPRRRPGWAAGRRGYSGWWLGPMQSPWQLCVEACSAVFAMLFISLMHSPARSPQAAAGHLLGTLSLQRGRWSLVALHAVHTGPRCSWLWLAVLHSVQA